MGRFIKIQIVLGRLGKFNRECSSPMSESSMPVCANKHGNASTFSTRKVYKEREGRGDAIDRTPRTGDMDWLAAIKAY